jgi:glutamate--cysteine ligase
MVEQLVGPGGHLDVLATALQFELAAQQSLERQAAMEAADELDFDSFVAEYQRSLSL